MKPFKEEAQRNMQPSPQQYDLPKITLRDFAFQRFSDEQSRVQKNSSLPKLYTVAQSLQDEYVYKNLKPDLGTLHEFLDGSLNMRHESRKYSSDRRRKKSEKPEETLEKRIRSHLQVHRRNPEDVLKSKEATFAERKVACRMLLENLFAKEFGEELEHFCSQPIKPYEWTQVPKHIQKFRERYTNPPGLEIELDDYLAYQEPKACGELVGSEETGKDKQPSREREVREHRRVISYDHTRLFAEIQKLRSKYKCTPLSNLDLSKSALINNGGYDRELEAMLELRRKEWEHPAAFEQEEEYRQQCRAINSPYKRASGQLFIVNAKYLGLRDMHLQPELFLYALLRGVHYESIRKMQLVRTNLTEELVCVTLEMINRLAFHIESIVIEGVQLTQRAIEILSAILSSSQLRHLALVNCRLTTKLFCQLCLGVGQSSTLESLEVPDNLIDARALKSINIVVRYVQQLRHFDLSGNKLTRLDEKTIKLLNQNRKFVLVGGITEPTEA